MKKFIMVCAALIVAVLMIQYVVFHFGFYIDIKPGEEVKTFVKTEGKEILLCREDQYEKFEIKGVDMGVGIPGHFATDFAIDKETYLRWFGMIKEMGANTIRVYTILHPDFYEAVFEYNQNNPDPLFVIHGLWVNDYTQNSHMDAYEAPFLQTFLDDSKVLVDVIHGKRKVALSEGYGSGTYEKDISPWVIGYILGVEWEDVTVAYTDEMRAGQNVYQGKYMYTSKEASPFEAMLAQVGDHIIAYESDRYKQQRLVAFSNWPTTDPFDYPDLVEKFFKKIAKVDVENIKTTEEFLAGTFASYHIYPYYPDYYGMYKTFGKEVVQKEKFIDEDGIFNSYRYYLAEINNYHTIPVVISEFGVPTSRGMAQKDRNTGRAQGRMSERDQGQAIISCYEDIKAAGCAGSCIFTWQDEWFKRTWNTMAYVDLTKTPFWSDYQTNEQYFGILSFDPGKEESVCYVDESREEWLENEVVSENEGMNISMKYDEKYLYFLIHKPNLKETEDVLYIPMDITPKSGSNYCKNFSLKFERPSDFVLVIDGKKSTRLMVQERYEVLPAVYWGETSQEDHYVISPDKNSPQFNAIDMLLQVATDLGNDLEDVPSEIYETGLLLHGNANPNRKEFNSLADFYIQGDYIEIKLPWQLLNFTNPSEMMIHDDYYEHYGIENLQIKKMYIGIGSKEHKKRIPMNEFPLKGWGSKVTYHERLKSSYYMIQKEWKKQDGWNQ